jgi:hypothetical protein
MVQYLYFSWAFLVNLYHRFDKRARQNVMSLIEAWINIFSVWTESADFGQRQGRRNFSTAGVAALRRGSKNFENAVFGQKMRFPFGHYLSGLVIKIDRYSMFCY